MARRDHKADWGAHTRQSIRGCLARMVCWVNRFLAKADPFTGINKPGVGLGLKTWSMA